MWKQVNLRCVLVPTYVLSVVCVPLLSNFFFKFTSGNPGFVVHYYVLFVI